MFCLWYKMLFNPWRVLRTFIVVKHKGGCIFKTPPGVKHWCCLGVFTVTLSAVLKEVCVYPYIEKP